MSSLDGESDKPVQIVRQFAPGIDHYPAYTTLELMLGGFCHVAWISHRNPYGVKRKRIGTERSVAVRQKAAMERFMESRAILRGMKQIGDDHIVTVGGCAHKPSAIRHVGE